MNRIVLIGNGFDLAHGMETSYHNFLNNYWENTINDIRKTRGNIPFSNEEISIERSPGEFVRGNKYDDLKNAVKGHQTKLIFKNKFLEIINEKANIDHWVDVENEYYFLLKQSFNHPVSNSNHRRLKSNYSVNQLNSDFNEIKKKLGKYLKEVEEQFDIKLKREPCRVKKIIGLKMYHRFKIKDFSESLINQRLEYEYSLLKNDINSLKEELIGMEDLSDDSRKTIKQIDLTNPVTSMRELLLSDAAFNYFDLLPNQTLLLNFNYTFTDCLYDSPKEFSEYNNGQYSRFESIHIHGTTAVNDDNEMIFGFGDELDEDYKLMERLNDNAYLENIKSINYLEASNYKKLLEFINSDDFQVFIFGHSCGISDRTMLNTIFEHDNCASIKPFYHQKGENEDNYSDIIRNISRNFNDKAKMRDRVVNKSYCEPLS